MLSQQEISDRLEIQDLLVEYSHCLDTRDFDGFDHVFTPDAVIDYTEMGGPRGDLESTKDFLRKAMAMFPNYQHMVATSKVVVDGDTATGRTCCHNPMIQKSGDPFWCGLWYKDTFVRTPEGWRIKDRYEEKCYTTLEEVPALPE